MRWELLGYGLTALLLSGYLVAAVYLGSGAP